MLRQINFGGEDKILSCPNCKMGDSSAFELIFDRDGIFVMGHCAGHVNNKSMVMRTYNDIVRTEIYEAFMDQIAAPLNIITIDHALPIKNLTLDKMKTYIVFS